MTYSEEELIPVVAYLADRYTSKESTSIPYRIARQLMGAAIYCIREFERNGDHAYRVSDIGNRPEAMQAYEWGYGVLLEKTRKEQNNYSEILLTFQCYDNYAYKDTFVDGISRFFIHYDARFRPQDHLLTLDYPLLCSLHHLCGVDRIERYITCVGLEQELLRRVPEEYIYYVLEAHHAGYNELLLNIAGVVYRNLLGCMIAGRRADLRTFSEAELERLKLFLKGKEKEELTAILNNYLVLMVKQICGDRMVIVKYLACDLPNFSYELLHACQHDCLDSVLAIA